MRVEADEILNEIRDGLFTTDLTGVLTFVNVPLAKMHGFDRPEEMIGKHFIEFAPPEFRTELLNKFKKAIEEESYSEIAEFPTFRKDGTTFFIQLKHGPIVRNGRIVGTAGVIRDVTDQKQAEQCLVESEKKYRSIVENMSDVVYIVDPTGKLLFITPSATRLLGYEQADMMGHNIREFTYKEDLDRSSNNIRHALSEKETIRNEYRLVRKDGGTLWIQTFTRPLFEGDDVVAVQGSFWDITERKHAEEALKSSERKFRDLITNMQEVLYTLDRNGRIIFVSPSVLSMTQYRDSEIIGHPIEEFIFGDDLPRLLRDLQNFLSGKGNRENEYRMVTKSGEIRWMRTCSSLLYEGAKIIGIQGILSDITEHKRSEEDVRATRDMLQLIMNNIPQGIFWKDRRSTYLGCNNVLARAAGLESAENIVGKTDFDLSWSTEQAESFREYDRKVMENDAPEYHIIEQQREADGSLSWVETNKVPLHDTRGNVIGILGTYEDITARRQVEAALKASEEKYRHLFKYAPTGIYEVDFVNKKITSVNLMMCQVLGYTEEEFLSMDPLDLLDEEGKRMVLERIMKILAGEKVDETVEYGIVAKDGRKLHCILNNAFIYEGGRVTGALVVAYDITERKQVEEALRESEEKFRSLVETTSDWIWEVDANGVYKYASPQVRNLLGYEPEEVLGRKPFEFMPLEESARLKAYFSQITKERKGCIGIENVNIRKDGRHVVLETSCVPRLDERGNLLGYRGIDRDITDRKRSEEVLSRSRDELKRLVQEKTAELEKRSRELQDFTFAAAHDLQEPLRKIQTFTDLLARDVDLESEQGRDYFKRMHKTATRMRDVLQSLMRYSLLSKGEPFVWVDLNEIALQAISDLELRIRDAGALVEVVDLPKIEADPGQMSQLFQNLLGNALKFRREGVQHKIRVHADCNPQKDECEISVSDNGIGFEERYLDLIFKPFHRLHSKDEYGGVGMGLAICSKVIEHHRGTLTARSTPGKGSTFIVTLPVKQGER